MLRLRAARAAMCADSSSRSSSCLCMHTRCLQSITSQQQQQGACTTPLLQRQQRPLRRVSRMEGGVVADAAPPALPAEAADIRGRVLCGAHVTPDGVLMVPTVYPSYAEFIDFNAFITRLESEGAGEVGLVRVVPPSDWPWLRDPSIWYRAANKETPALVAKKRGVNLERLLALNRPTFGEALGATSRLVAGTVLQLPQQQEQQQDEEAGVATSATADKQSLRDDAAAAALSPSLLATDIRPIKQCMSNGSMSGSYSLQLIERKPISIRDFRHLANTKHAPPQEVVAALEPRQQCAAATSSCANSTPPASLPSSPSSPSPVVEGLAVWGTAEAQADAEVRNSNLS